MIRDSKNLDQTIVYFFGLYRKQKMAYDLQDSIIVNITRLT